MSKSFFKEAFMVFCIEVASVWNKFMLFLQRCAVEFEVKAFSGDSADEKAQKRYMAVFVNRESLLTAYSHGNTRELELIDDLGVMHWIK